MATKECRHCRQQIHPEARRCHQCRASQGWIADQTDPRVWILALGVLVALVGPLIVFMFYTVNRIEARDIPRASPVLQVEGVRVEFQPTGLGLRSHVVGTVVNQGSTDAGAIWIRVVYRGPDRKPLETFLEEAVGLLVPAGESRLFRVSEIVALSAEKAADIEVTVARSRAPERWD